MDQQVINTVYNIAIWALPVILAITLHEAGHAWAASRLGDKTAQKLGRVSLNPAPHIDPIGTIVLPLIMYLTSPIIFGWAKPVPVIPSNLYRPRRDMALVAMAGPGANFLMVVAWALLFKITTLMQAGAIIDGVAKMALAGIFINFLLAFFNLLPLPPLDGGRVLVSVLPQSLAGKIASLEKYGIIIVLALFFLAGLGKFLFALIVNGMALTLAIIGIESPPSILHSFFQSLSSGG